MSLTTFKDKLGKGWIKQISKYPALSEKSEKLRNEKHNRQKKVNFKPEDFRDTSLLEDGVGCTLSNSRRVMHTYAAQLLSRVQSPYGGCPQSVGDAQSKIGSKLFGSKKFHKALLSLGLLNRCLKDHRGLLLWRWLEPHKHCNWKNSARSILTVELSEMLVQTSTGLVF